jgi:hypothetical protein
VQVTCGGQFAHVFGDILYVPNVCALFQSSAGDSKGKGKGKGKKAVAEAAPAESDDAKLVKKKGVSTFKTTLTEMFIKLLGTSCPSCACAVGRASCCCCRKLRAGSCEWSNRDDLAFVVVVDGLFVCASSGTSTRHCKGERLSAAGRYRPLEVRCEDSSVVEAD